MAATGVFAYFLLVLAVVSSANAYWLMNMGNFIVSERLDPLVSPGVVSGHTHSVLGGSNFGPKVTTKELRESKCTSAAVQQDKSNYWFPHMYFQYANGSFASLTGGSVVCMFRCLGDVTLRSAWLLPTDYLFNDKSGVTTAFPDDFRMLTGDPTLRTYNASSYAQQAVTFLCLDFNGVSTRHNEIPAQACASGVRAQINFPSCWDGKNLDSVDHKSHVAFPSGGPDSGTCSDPKFPVTLPRIFMEVYWGTEFEAHRSEAKNPSQPYVYAYGDETGYGYHADFINGWAEGVLQKAVDGCHCNPYGDPTCCAQAGIFDFESNPQQCHITPQVDEVVLGMLPKLPGNNPVQTAANAVGGHIKMLTDSSPPGFLSPTTAYTTDTPPAGSCQVGHGTDIGANCKLIGSAPASSNATGSSNTTVTSNSTVPSAPVGSSSAAVGSSSTGNAPSSVPTSSTAKATPSSASTGPSSAPAGPSYPSSGPSSAPAASSSPATNMPASNAADDTCDDDDHKYRPKKHSAKFAHHHRTRRSHGTNFH